MLKNIGMIYCSFIAFYIPAKKDGLNENRDINNFAIITNGFFKREKYNNNGWD
jgi:hypothetical protein